VSGQGDARGPLWKLLDDWVMSKQVPAGCGFLRALGTALLLVMWLSAVIEARLMRAERVNLSVRKIAANATRALLLQDLYLFAAPAARQRLFGCAASGSALAARVAVLALLDEDVAAHAFGVAAVTAAPAAALADALVLLPGARGTALAGQNAAAGVLPEFGALEVLAAVLSGGESSRLHQRLVRREHLAIAAGGVTEALEHPGLFLVYAAYLPDRDAGRVQAVLAEEIANVRDKPITSAELDKAKNQLAAGFVFGLQTVDGVAQALGRAQYVEGDWKRFVESATRYLAVTAADVQRVAAKYLVDTNLTRITLAQPSAPQEKK